MPQLLEGTSSPHAVLIGVSLSIDSSHQESHPNDRSLKGAVPDIIAVNDYLRSQDHIKITKLTTSKPPIGSGTSAPIEAPGHLPSLGNVCSVLWDVIRAGEQGSCKHVYIHFSGYGTRIFGTGEFGIESDISKYFSPGTEDVPCDSVLKLDRILNLKGNTIITACGPYEVTEEINFTPMRYSNSGVSFFDSILYDASLSIVPVFHSKDNNYFVLNAGYTHRVQENNKYNMCLSFASEHAEDKSPQKPITLRVQVVENLTSELIVVNSSHAKYLLSQQIWKARPLISFSPRKVVVGLMPSLPDPDKAEMLRMTAVHRQLSSSRQGFELSTFSVDLNSRDNYETQDISLNAICGLQSVPRHSEEALGRLKTTLEHLAKFKFFKGIDNKYGSVFEASFSVEINGNLRQDSWYDVKTDVTTEKLV